MAAIIFIGEMEKSCQKLFERDCKNRIHISNALCYGNNGMKIALHLTINKNVQIERTGAFKLYGISYSHYKWSVTQNSQSELNSAKAKLELSEA